VVAWYSGSSLGARRFLGADERGSIISVSGNGGGSQFINRYDEYGVPQSGNTGRFQYTGQQWQADSQLYYYKSRFYSPYLGRFMQTDPVGYRSGLNLYNYAGSDPVNLIDSLGLQDEPPKSICDTADCVIIKAISLYPTMALLSAFATRSVSLGLQNFRTPTVHVPTPQNSTCAAALRVAGKNQSAINRANAAWGTISNAATAHGIDPALLAAVGVRETGFQNIAEAGGGGGMGVFQLTNQPGVTSRQAYDLTFSANYAASMLASNMTALAKAFPNFTSPQLLQATAASYNFGLGNIRGNPATIDVGTTHNNYGSNVVNLMSCF
jgi:RHS repeat-associated protein